MNKEIVLSIEQMQHLQELGLDCSGASMCHYKVIYSLFLGEKILEEWFLYFMNDKHYPSNFKEIDDIDGIDVSKVEEVVPAFCLQDILELLPKRIMKDNESYLDIRPDIIYLRLCISYFDINTNEIIMSFRSSNLIDAAYHMLCWCIDNGYIKTKP